MCLMCQMCRYKKENGKCTAVAVSPVRCDFLNFTFPDASLFPRERRNAPSGFSAFPFHLDWCGLSLGRVSVCGALRISPVLVLLVLLLFEARGTKSLAGQSGLHVLDLSRPQLPDGRADEAPLVQIHGSFQLQVRHEKTIKKKKKEGMKTNGSVQCERSGTPNIWVAENRHLFLLLRHSHTVKQRIHCVL